MMREVLMGRREMYWAGLLLVAAVVIWSWHAQVFSFPFWGDAPLFALAVGNGIMPAEPMSVYLFVGKIFSIPFGVELGLVVLGFLGGLTGLVGLMYMVLQLTQDRSQAVLCAGLFVLFPVMMRQVVVQEPGGILVGLVLVSLAVVMSKISRRYEIAGILFGAAVGVHMSVIWLVPGIWFMMRENEDGLKVWAVWGGGVAGVALLWALLQAQATGIGGLSYLLTGVGIDAYSPSLWFSNLVMHVDLFARLFGWCGFGLGSVGLVLMAFQNREQFQFLILLGGPFLLYRVLNTAPGDDVIYLLIFGVIFALAAGTAWRVGSRYLAEGLQETERMMFVVVGVSVVVIQLVCVFYTQNVWADALARRVVYADRIEAFQGAVAKLKVHTRPNDFIVVMADPKRPGILSMAPSPWGLMWHIQRPIVFGKLQQAGWAFDVLQLPSDGRRVWVSQHDEANDAFVKKALREERRFFSYDPFPLMHASHIEEWLSALPVGDVEGLFELRLGRWPDVENPENVAKVLQKTFDLYVSRGYTLDAAACLQGVVAYRPTDTTYLRKLGDLYMKMGIYQSAVVIYGKLLTLEPDVEEVAVNLSGAYYSMEALDEAISVCEQFLIAHPFSPEILYNLAGYYAYADRKDEARELYKLYLQMGDTAHRKDEVFQALKELELP